MPNPWNVNHLNAFTYAKLLESIEEFGFIDPLLVRPHPSRQNDYEIIGGKHRWQAAGDLLAGHPELAELPVIVRAASDTQAKKLSLIDNELHGQADPIELADLLRDLGPDEFLTSLPYTQDILGGFLGIDLDSHAVPDLPPPAASSSAPEGGTVDPWVERTYRMPSSVAQVLDDAMAKAKGEAANYGQEMGDFQALEVLAAEYLAS